MFLAYAGHETRYILERDNRDVEAVTEADEARGFFAGLDVQNTSQHCRLVGNDPDAVTAQPRKSYDDIGRVVLVNLEEATIVHDHVDGLFDVVGFVRAVRDE